MSEAEKRRKDRQELHDMLRLIEPAKNEDIARKAVGIADYWLIKSENQAKHIQDLEARNSKQTTIEPTANSDKYEYHYEHTDCIWYRPEARNRCPSTCAQYRDGWNDAMNYIFRDGKGYRPYRRDKQYEERKEGEADERL